MTGGGTRLTLTKIHLHPQSTPRLLPRSRSPGRGERDLQEHTRVVRLWAAASECQYGRVVSSIRGVGLEGPTSWKLPVWLVDARRRSGGGSGLEAVKHNGSWAELTLAQSYGFSAYAAIGMGHRILSIVSVLVCTSLYDRLCSSLISLNSSAPSRTAPSAAGATLGNGRTSWVRWVRDARSEVSGDVRGIRC